MVSKKVNVQLFNIFNDNTGDDPGNGLEIYGRFDVARLAFNPDIGEVVTLVSFNLFDRPSDNAQDIVEGTAFIVGSLAQLEIFEGEFLQITGNIGDEDTFGSNDNLGGVDIRIPFNDLASKLVPLPVFEESNQRVTVKMSLTVT